MGKREAKNGRRMREWLAGGLVGVAVGACILLALVTAAEKTSTNEYCMKCHYHEHQYAPQFHFLHRSYLLLSMIIIIRNQRRL